jgi:hypothetical protein
MSENIAPNVQSKSHQSRQFFHGFRRWTLGDKIEVWGLRLVLVSELLSISCDVFLHSLTESRTVFEQYTTTISQTTLSLFWIILIRSILLGLDLLKELRAIREQNQEILKAFPAQHPQN